MSDIYASPTAELDNTKDYDGGGSLARGIAGDYKFSIEDALREAWQRTQGAKLTLNLAMLLYILVAVVAVSVVSIAFFAIVGAPENGQPGAGFVIGSILQQLIYTAIIMPMAIGLFILGLRRAVDAPISATRIFSYFDRALPLILTYVLLTILVTIGFFLLVIPGIYLSVAFILAMPLVVEKNLGPVEALKASLKAVTKRWFAVFGFFLVIGVINFVAALPLGIGLFWTAPMSIIAMGILYRQIFGCEAATRAP